MRSWISSRANAAFITAMRYSVVMGQRQPLPDLWLLSDARNDELLPRALRALPRGSAFVFRHYHLDPRARRARWDELLPLVREGGHLAVLSGSDDEALRWGAAGSYGPPEAVGEAPELLRIAAAHDGHEIAHANASGADAAMLSPVFETRTHPGAVPLGPEKFHALAALAEMPVIALGGMTFERAKQLGWMRWAAIDGLALKQDS
ncbi:thiamine phosphate synthase [Tsuneonella troitsensis]|uniref:thiamine phosphate synthase n=2 Tax=Tsuneonella troitsensis TaxID=292222 RepID=UPI0030B9AB69